MDSKNENEKKQVLIAGKEKEGYGIIIMTLDAGNQPAFFSKYGKIRPFGKPLAEYDASDGPILFGKVIKAEEKAEWTLVNGSSGDDLLHYGGWYRMFKNAEDARRYLNEVYAAGHSGVVTLCVKCVIPEQGRFIDDNWRYIRICDDPVHGYRTFDDLCTHAETYLAEEICFEKAVYGMKGPKKVPDELLKRLLEELGFTVEIDG